MATHSHRILINAPKEEVFEAITTEQGLQGWYTPNTEGDAGHGEKIKLHFKTKDGPFHWDIEITKPGSVVRWECLKGPGSAAGTTATFSLDDKGAGKTSVDLDHEGLDEEDDKLKVCNTMWGVLMLHLKKYAETKKPEPAFH
jgi:uncharacterized protein YndB with AHSA1/START domain